MRKFDGMKVHLTMYGTHIDEGIPKVKADVRNKMLIVVGAEKVPPEVYQWADYNIGVGNQPHSEVAALAVFLDRYQDRQSLQKDFEGKTTVIPCERGKNVVIKDSQ